ncbi:MAG: dihydrofolate reductase family protein [Corallococcus sp.]|nr:dihydrofolate reductase family protein [Corallococcus sp.]
MERCVTTLFMLTSLDGKISTGSTNETDFDKDFPAIDGVKQGLRQYYDIEQTTDLWSLISGKTQAKLGVNEKPLPKSKGPVSFVLIDNNNLTQRGVEYFCALSQTFVLVTVNPNHPSFNVKETNLHIVLQEHLNMADVFRRLKCEYGCERITVQTGGTLNALMLREKLIDYVDIVVAPVLVGGKDTPSLIDGESFTNVSQLCDVAPLELLKVRQLRDSYLRLTYRTLKR